jgi:hypothetical protein
VSCPRCRCESCQARNDRLPGGISGVCLTALAASGGSASTSGIHAWTARQELSLTLAQVRTCLHGLARRDNPLIALTAAGRPGNRSPGGQWQLTPRGRELLFAAGTSVQAPVARLAWAGEHSRSLPDGL